MPNQTVKNGLKATKIKLPQMNFFLEKQNFHVPIGPLHLENFKKILRANPESWRWAIFGPQMAHFSWTKFFWYKPLLLLSSIYGIFHCAKFKKNLTADPELCGCAILGPKMVHFPPTKFFFGKLLRSFSSTHWPLSLCKI